MIQFDNFLNQLTIFQAYAPNSTYKETDIIAFYQELQHLVNLTHRDNDIMLMGNFNANLGSDASLYWPGIAGKFIPGQRNENGERFVEFCNFNGISVGNTYFKHKLIHKLTSQNEKRT